MKPVIIKLNEEQRKGLQAIVENLRGAKSAMIEAGKVHCDYSQKLWEYLYDWFPQTKKFNGTQDASFEFENYEIRYFVPDKKSEEFKLLKESAIKAQDWEKAAMYREQEKTAREEEEKA